MTTALLDTVGLLAPWDTADQWHEAAEKAFEELCASPAQLVTTSYILLECGNAAARRPYRSAVARFREQMQQSGQLIVLTDGDWQTAWASYARGDAGETGIVDQESFVIMWRLGIAHALRTIATSRPPGSPRSSDLCRPAGLRRASRGITRAQAGPPT